MAQTIEYHGEAPTQLHARLDRLWLVREQECAVSFTAVVRDPENAEIEYLTSVSLERIILR